MTSFIFSFTTPAMAGPSLSEEAPASPQWDDAPAPAPAPETEDDPGRPRNAWIIFRSAELADRHARGIRKTQAEFSKELSLIWRGMSADEKRPYEIAAEKEKAEHKRRYPNYRFHPKKKEDKARLKAAVEARRAVESGKQKVRKGKKNTGGVRKNSRRASGLSETQIESQPMGFVGVETASLPGPVHSSLENAFDVEDHRAALSRASDCTAYLAGDIDFYMPPPLSWDVEVGQYGAHAGAVDVSRLDPFSQLADSPISIDPNSPLYAGMFMNAQLPELATDYATATMQSGNMEATPSTGFASFNGYDYTQSAPLSANNALNIDFDGSAEVSRYSHESATFTFDAYDPLAGPSNAGAGRVARSWGKTAVPDSPVQCHSSSWAVPS